MSINTQFSKVIKAGNTPEPELHPEDRKNHIDGAAYGKKHAPKFCEKHAAKLVQLIAVYADGAAHDALDMLREAFWSVDVEEDEQNG